MNRFWQQSRPTDLESELLHRRPVPRDEFVSSLARTIDGRPERSRTGRIGAAIAVAGLALVALGVGGAGYAYSSGSTPTAKVSGVHLNQSGQIQEPATSGHAQYGPVPVPPHPAPKPPPTTTPTPPPTTPTPPTTTTPPTTSPTAPLTPPTTTTPTGGGTSPGTSGSQTGGSETGGQTSGQPSESSSLPFTGLSLIFPVLLGAGLIAFGVFLRRRGRATPR